MNLWTFLHMQASVCVCMCQIYAGRNEYALNKYAIWKQNIQSWTEPIHFNISYLMGRKFFVSGIKRNAFLQKNFHFFLFADSEIVNWKTV